MHIGEPIVRSVQSWALALGTLLAAACVPGTEPSRTNIINGTSLDDFADARATSSVAYTYRQPDGSINFCSGVLVHYQLILTAGHCIEKATSIDKVFFGYNIYDGAVGIQAKSFGWDKRFQREAKGSINYDLGWIKLRDPIPVGYHPISVLTDASALPETASVVGYGKNASFFSNDQGKRSEATVNVDQIILNDIVGGTQFRGVITVHSPEGAGACYGDSGGPLYAYVNNQWMLAGTTHGVDKDLFPEVDIQTSACEAAQTAFVQTSERLSWIAEQTGIDLRRGSGTQKLVCPDHTVFQDGFCTLTAAGQPLVVGQFPKKMMDACLNKYPAAICRKQHTVTFNGLERTYSAWPKDVAVSLRGDGHCPAGLNATAETMGYCGNLEEKTAFGPFPTALVERCHDEEGGEACYDQQWSFDTLQWLLGTPSAHQEWIDLSSLSGDARAEAEAYLAGMEDPKVKELKARVEGKVLVIASDSTITGCVHFSQEPGKCRINYSVYGEWVTWGPGKCNLSWVPHGRFKYLNVHCLTETGLACNPHQSGGGGAVGLTTGIPPASGVLDPTADEFISIHSQGLFVRDQCAL